jgi:hypothetical protein
MLGPVGTEKTVDEEKTPSIPLTRRQRRLLIKRFQAESRHRRRQFKKDLIRNWESKVAPSYDQENGNPDAPDLMDEELAYDGFMSHNLDQFDQDVEMKREAFLDDLSCATSCLPNGTSQESTIDASPDDLLLRRTEELWAGLRRVYFGEVEDPSGSDEDEPKPRTRQSVTDFKTEIAEIRAHIRQERPPRVPDDLHVPIPPPMRRQDDDSDDEAHPRPLFPIFPLPPGDTDEDMFGQTPAGDRPNGEDTDTEEELHEAEEMKRWNPRYDKFEAAVAALECQAPMTKTNILVSERGEDVLDALSNAMDNGDGVTKNGVTKSDQSGDLFLRRACVLADATRKSNTTPRKSLRWATPLGLIYDHVPTENEFDPKAMEPLLDRRACILADTTKRDQKCQEAPKSDGTFPLTNGEGENGEYEYFEVDESFLTNGEARDADIRDKERNGGSLGGFTKDQKWSSLSNSKGKLQQLAQMGIRKALITVKTIRRILNFKESIMKYGVFVPKNDNEADASPEHLRWESGRMLEWMRLQNQGTFERNWDWSRVQKKFPTYKRRDVGHVFFVYDFKHSGEHRVRLVFDGSRQNPETYTDTYAPTARGESVRLFHVYSVEEGWIIAQYDVPQAFLKSQIDCDLFVYPPRNFSEFPGQLLKLRLSLYGAKQSAALWNKMIDSFLQSLGFSPSPMDPCLYRRSDALIILFVDDLRVAASPSVLAEIHAALFDKFQITTSDGTRFLGMDTMYNVEKGYLKLHMETYIVSIHERFHAFDLSHGVPFREIVGCLLWVCLCIMGPELLRVKDLARRSNDYNEDDFKVALKVLDRIYARRTHGIVIVRGGAGTELVPSSTRGSDETAKVVQEEGGTDIGFMTGINEMREKALYKVKEEIADEDIKPVVLPLNKRYNLIIYADASFAVGDTMQSVSGYIVYLNGTPLLWGSLKQTIVVDSSCSAEYVASSVACKQAIHAENLIGFLGFSCPKPYVMYTDSTACLSIASNALRLGNVRHLAIRYNLVRCYVSIGEVTMRYCVTEEMVADLLTKIVAGAQDARLTIRFYCLCPFGTYFVEHHM